MPRLHPLFPLLRAALLSLVLSATGCASSRVGRFPTPAELAELQAGPGPEFRLEEDSRSVDLWQLTGPFRETISLDSHSGTGPWDRLLSEAAGPEDGRVALPVSTHCVAREFGLFFLKQRALPSPELRAFIHHRCGETAVSISRSYLSGDVLPHASEEEVFAQWEPQVRELVRPLLQDGNHSLGVWFGRDQDRAVLMLVSGRRQVRIEPVTLRPDARGRVLIEGALLEPAEHIEALITAGPYGVVECATDPTVALPRFSLVCMPRPEDDWTVFSLSAQAPGRPLSRQVLSLLLLPGDEPGRTYVEPPAVITESLEMTPQGFLAGVNSVRAKAGLGPLQLSEPQSATHRRLLPYLLGDPPDEQSEEIQDRAALGLMAGWEVSGLIRRGNFASAMLPEVNDLGCLLTDSLSSPMTRSLLLDPEADVLAVGILVQEAPEGIAAVMSSYALFEETDYSLETAELLKGITEARAERGLTEPMAMGEVRDMMKTVVSRIQQGTLRPSRGLNDLLDLSSAIYAQGIKSWRLECSSIEQVEIPEELLTTMELELTVGVSHYRPKGEPWGRLVVFFVAAFPPGT